MVTYGEMGIEHYGFEALMGKGRERLGKATKFYITLCTIAGKKKHKTKLYTCCIIKLAHIQTYTPWRITVEVIHIWQVVDTQYDFNLTYVQGTKFWPWWRIFFGGKLSLLVNRWIIDVQSNLSNWESNGPAISHIDGSHLDRFDYLLFFILLFLFHIFYSVNVTTFFLFLSNLRNSVHPEWLRKLIVLVSFTYNVLLMIFLFILMEKKYFIFN